MKRGDIVLVRFPHPSGQRGKKRRKDPKPRSAMGDFGKGLGGFGGLKPPGGIGARGKADDPGQKQPGGSKPIVRARGKFTDPPSIKRQ